MSKTDRIIFLLEQVCNRPEVVTLDESKVSNDCLLSMKIQQEAIHATLLEIKISLELIAQRLEQNVVVLDA